MKNNEKHEKQLNKKITPQRKPNSLVTNRVTKIGHYNTYNNLMLGTRNMSRETTGQTLLPRGSDRAPVGHRS